MDFFGSYPDPARPGLEPPRCELSATAAALPPIRMLVDASSLKVSRPPFRSRRGSLIAESAAARLHFRHTSHGCDMRLVCNASTDSRSRAETCHEVLDSKFIGVRR